MRNEVYAIYFYQILIWIFGFNLFGIPLLFILEDFKAYIDPTLAIHPFLGILLNVFSGILTGIVLGTIDIWIERNNARKTSFRRVFLTKSFAYILAFIIMVAFTGLEIRLIATRGDWAASIEAFQTDDSFHIMMAYFSFSVMYSLIVGVLSQVRRNYGRGTLIPLFTGKYYTPKENERIFMFLDMNSATPTAERLGHILFSQLIQDCFYDLNRIVNKYKASIYQYVGDEVILVWNVKDGVEKSNCLALFFAFKDILNQRQEHYKKHYNQLPTFKAGLNYGMVTIVEIGVIKKELTYHGDVLNTASRIQGMCKKYNEDCLISKDLFSLFENQKNHKIDFLDKLLLKGKSKYVEVFSVQKL